MRFFDYYVAVRRVSGSLWGGLLNTARPATVHSPAVQQYCPVLQYQNKKHYLIAKALDNVALLMVCKGGGSSSLLPVLPQAAKWLV